MSDVYDGTDVNVEEEQKKISNYLEAKASRNAIVLKASETRNIIFLGRTRSGKSTVLKILKNPFGFCDSISLFSETKKPRLFSFTVEHKEEDLVMNYNINIMDTPGLFERAIVDADKRNNEMIKTTISQCLEFEITNIHCLLFVCSFEGGINDQDIASILDLNKLFKGADKSFSLLVTRCESKLATRRQELEAQIRKIPELGEFFENPAVQIFFSGALDRDDFDNGALDSVKRNLENLLALRKTLYQHFLQAESPCHITQLDFFKDHRESVELMKKTVETLTAELTAAEGRAGNIEELETKLALATEKLTRALSVIQQITGQNDLKMYEDVINKSTAASAAKKRA